MPPGRARVPVSNNGGSNSVAVAEHTLALILAVYKQVVRDHNNVVSGKWRVGDFAELRIYELAGKTLGLVGLGTIGKRVARRAQAFDMRVQYHDTIRLERGPGRRPRPCASCSSPNCCAPRTWSACTCR